MAVEPFNRTIVELKPCLRMSSSGSVLLLLIEPLWN